MNWYVVNTHSGYENKAKLALEDAIQRAGIEHKFGEVLVPTEQVVDCLLYTSPSPRDS